MVKSIKPTLSLDIQYGSQALEEKWSEIFKTRTIRKCVMAALQTPATITLRLVSTAEGRKLNREYRNKDYATNILTFTYPRILEGDDEEILADLVICLPVIAKEAKEQKKSIEDHFSHMLVHGLLHAQGFDHEDEIEAEGMESLEISILSKLKIANPYL